MMSKVKVKKIKIPANIKDEGLAELFNQMLGTGTVNLAVAYPRYIKIKNICVQLIKIFKLLNDTTFMKKHAELAAQNKQIDEFCTKSTEAINEIFSVNLDDYIWNISLVDDITRKTFSDVYINMKKSDLVKKFIIMCDRLVVYKKYFINIDNLNYKFITNMAGTVWQPFPFTSLNIKTIFSMPDIGECTKTFFMTIFSKSYELSRQLYEEIQSPDVDVDQFVDFIMKNLNEIQKQPALHRCTEAFQKIRESVKLLKERFNNYYHDFITTKDNTIIMQHFILDISKETGSSDARVARQFATIIQYFNNVKEANSTNPRLKVLFDKANESLRELETYTENIVNIQEDSDTESDSDTASILTSPSCISLDALQSELQKDH